jgi:DNA-binding NarL/FixJ family response regulator
VRRQHRDRKGVVNIRVFLVDDHAVVRDGLRALLESQTDIRVIGDAHNGRTAVQAVERLRPDVVIMDLAMPEMNGIEATEQIRNDCPDTQVVVLSMHSTSEYIFRALKAGARGYVLKESAGVEVTAAVRAVHLGRRYYSERIIDTMPELLDILGDELDLKSPLERLSAREREVLQLVVGGGSSPAIAAKLHLSVKTVETYRSRLMRKLGVEDLTDLVKFAIEHGLIPRA